METVVGILIVSWARYPLLMLGSSKLQPPASHNRQGSPMVHSGCAAELCLRLTRAFSTLLLSAYNRLVIRTGFEEHHSCR